MRQRFLLIHNPFAGLRGHTLAHRTARALERQGASVIVVRSRGMGVTQPNYADLLPTLHLKEFDAVLAAGGDGTVRALAAECAKSNIPMGIIPMGTGNVLAHEIRLSRSPREIADVAINGPAQTIYGATINDETFFLMAGIGFDGDVIARLNTNTKRRIGKLAYTIPLIRASARKPQEIIATIDGKQHRATWIVAANISHYAGRFTIAPRANIREPQLSAVLFKGKSRRDRFTELLALATGRLRDCKTVAILPCQHLIVEKKGGNNNIDKKMSVEVDGDTFGHTPAEIKAGTVKLNLIVPPHFSQGT